MEFGNQAAFRQSKQTAFPHATEFAFVQALRGNDVVGSSVRIKLKKPSGKFFECTVQRGSIARIQAIGDLFLMLTEMISGIQNRGKKPTVGDIMG